MTPLDETSDVASLILDAFDQAPTLPRVLGVSGTQGSGKSTVSRALRQLLQQSGRTTAVLSLDDLYLTRSARLDLAARVHPLLATRGPPGTHDVGLGCRLLDALFLPGEVLLPRFDKATDDRLPASSWLNVHAPVEVVIFEGWCLGAQAQSAEDVARPLNALEAEEDAQGVWRRFVNAALARDYAPLFERIDFLVYLAPPDLDVVFGWRQEQEQKLRAAHGDGSGVMTDAHLRRFIQHYDRLTRSMMETLPGRADLTIALDRNRRPTDVLNTPAG